MKIKRKKRIVSKEQRYRVNIDLRAKDVARADAAVEFVIFGPNGRLGMLQIGQGTLGWKGASDQKFRRIAWARFFKKIPNI